MSHPFWIVGDNMYEPPLRGRGARPGGYRGVFGGPFPTQEAAEARAEELRLFAPVGLRAPFLRVTRARDVDHALRRLELAEIAQVRDPATRARLLDRWRRVQRERGRGRERLDHSLSFHSAVRGSPHRGESLRDRSDRFVAEARAYLAKHGDDPFATQSAIERWIDPLQQAIELTAAEEVDAIRSANWRRRTRGARDATRQVQQDLEYVRANLQRLKALCEGDRDSL